MKRAETAVLVNEVALLIAAMTLPIYGGIQVPVSVCLERAKAVVQFIILSYDISPKRVEN